MIKGDKEDNHLNEPQAVYKRTGLRFFNSFEEADEADAKEMAALTGQEHFANAHLLICAIFKEVLKEPFDKTIKTR